MKAGLDLEIGMFRCLVDTEEERLGLKLGDLLHQYWSYIDLQVKVNGEVSQDTGETHLGTLSLATMETSGLNTLDDKEEGGMHMEMEMEEVRRPGSSDCQGQELEGRDFQEEEIVRQEVPVIDVTTPSQDGSCEKLLWKILVQTLHYRLSNEN